jgi:hypothetical protein
MDLLILNLITRWGVRRQLHTPGNFASYPLSRVWVGYITVLEDWEKSFLSRSGVEPGFFGRASCSLVTVLTAVS